MNGSRLMWPSHPSLPTPGLQALGRRHPIPVFMGLALPWPTF